MAHQFAAQHENLRQDPNAGEEDVFMSDNAVLQYDPELEESPIYTPERSIPVKATKATKPKNKKATRTKEDEAASVATSSESEALVTKGKGKRMDKATKATKSKAIKLTEDEIDAQLKASILSDTQLYHRILRYEPIPFDAFVDLVAGPDSGIKVTGPLKLQVRAFLDKQVSTRCFVLNAAVR